MSGGTEPPSDPARAGEPPPIRAEAASIEPGPSGGQGLPPDPDAYDSPRAVQARARGLSAPYIAGGLDPDMDTARRDERRNLRILMAMVVVIVLSGFVLGYIAKLLGFG